MHIDIANDPVSSADYKHDEDPTKFKSEKTGRGPLVGHWMDKVQFTVSFFCSCSSVLMSLDVDIL